MEKLFAELLKECLNMEKGTSDVKNVNMCMMGGSIAKDRRPFINVFKGGKSRTKRVFTNTPICNFLELVIQRGTIKKAIGVIEKSKYKKALKIDYDEKIMENCEHYNKQRDKWHYNGCVEKKVGKTDFEEKCNKCPIKWIYSTLQSIEVNYENIVLEVSEKYCSDEEQELVENIYKDIRNFEMNYNDDCDKVKELYENCKECLEKLDKDVKDEKLAYVKWYTAHMCNWLKIHYLIKNESYTYKEEEVYKMLYSASNIMAMCDKVKGELMADIETEKMVSYISCRYLKDGTIYDSIKERCERILSLPISDDTRLKIYVEIWNLSMYIEESDAEEFRKEIESILLKEGDRTVMRRELEAKYYLYQYMHKKEKLDLVESILEETARCLKNEQVKSVTMIVISKLFYKMAMKELDVQKTNAVIIWKKINGLKDNESLDKLLLDCPSKYMRVYEKDLLDKWVGW